MVHGGHLVGSWMTLESHSGADAGLVKTSTQPSALQMVQQPKQSQPFGVKGRQFSPQVADWVAPSNNDHGVHAALVRYGLCT